MEIVYVAHLPAMAFAADLSGQATTEVSQSFDDTACELSEAARAHLQAAHRADCPESGFQALPASARPRAAGRCVE
jgi:hypothetical protein